MRLIGNVVEGWQSLAGTARRIGWRRTLAGAVRYARELRFEAGFDRRFGTETAKFVGVLQLEGVGPHQGDAVEYLPSRPGEFQDLVDVLQDEDLRGYSFVDLGCGKGRVLVLAAALPFGRVVGVEFSAKLAAVAEANLASYRGARACQEVEVMVADAATFDFPPTDLVVYLFNPFGPRVLAEVLRNLLRERPRRVFVLYNNDVHSPMLAEAGFRLVARGRGERWPWSVHQAH